MNEKLDILPTQNRNDSNNLASRGTPEPLAQRVRSLSRTKLLLAAVAALRLLVSDPIKAEEHTIELPPAAGRVRTPEEQAANEKALAEDKKAQEAVKKVMEELREKLTQMRKDREEMDRASEEAFRRWQEESKNRPVEKSPFQKKTEGVKRQFEILKEINAILAGALRGDISPSDVERIKELTTE